MSKIEIKNVVEFSLDLTKFKDLAAEQHKALLKKVAFQLLELIVTKNPVKTGRSQNNWQVAVDSAAGDTVIDGIRTPQAIVEDGLSQLADVEAFSVIILYNNVEYIAALEDGSSTQAPEGMVAISIVEVEEQFT
ncbi:MAG: hypothetical protein GY794_16305 [bacterium]|nr:hypothetical protein [bacterium]